MKATALKKSFLFSEYIINYFQDLVSVYHTSVLGIIHFSWREILGRALVKSFQQVSVEERATLRHQSRDT